MELKLRRQTFNKLAKLRDDASGAMPDKIGNKTLNPLEKADLYMHRRVQVLLAGIVMDTVEKRPFAPPVADRMSIYQCGQYKKPLKAVFPNLTFLQTAEVRAALKKQGFKFKDQTITGFKPKG